MRRSLTVFFGLIASGKSTLAAAFAQKHGLVYLNTDRVRKELAGLEPTRRGGTAFGEGIYTAEMTQKTYDVMLERAATALERQQGVVLDGSYSRLVHRQQVRACAEQCGVSAHFILCQCSEGEVRRRLARRARDPEAVSDGHWEIFCKQQRSFEFPDELDQDRLLILETEEEVGALIRQVEEWLAVRP